MCKFFWLTWYFEWSSQILQKKLSVKNIEWKYTAYKKLNCI